MLRWASLNFSSAFLSSPILISPPRSIFHLWNDQVECNNTNGSQRYHNWTQHLKHWNREGYSLITSMFQIKKKKNCTNQPEPSQNTFANNWEGSIWIFLSDRFLWGLVKYFEVLGGRDFLSGRNIYASAVKVV